VISALSHIARLTHAGYVFAREGVFALVDTRTMPLPARAGIALARLIERPTKKEGSGRLAAALTKLGPTYVKLGQFMATRPDVVGTQIANNLESLQDRMAPFPQAQAEAVAASAFDKPLGEVYASLGPAVAAASIAQVH
jgi:ubiquinone biosynthesis protein